MNSGTESDPASFEDSLGELQEIVDELESGAPGLEDALRKFERGAALLRHCYGLLESAEQRIEILTGRSTDGAHETAPFDASATHEPAAAKAGRRQKSRSGKAAEPAADDPAGLF
jgi:exodeoxyribonuclease VII small subunit